MTHFREVQKFRQPWLWAILLAPAGLLAWGAWRQLRFGRPWGSRPLPDPYLLLLCGAVAVFLLWFYSLRLVTELRNGELTVQFVPMWRKKVIALGEIRSAEAVEYRPIRDYGGWGIRRGLTGWAYTVRGNRGVLVRLRNGGELLIGSQRAEELAAILGDRLRVPDSR